MENNNYSISFFDGFVPKDIFNHKYKKLPFKSYQVSRISDNEVIIYGAWNGEWINDSDKW